jgi:hypothetical protein
LAKEVIKNMPIRGTLSKALINMGVGQIGECRMVSSCRKFSQIEKKIPDFGFDSAQPPRAHSNMLFFAGEGRQYVVCGRRSAVDYAEFGPLRHSIFKVICCIHGLTAAKQRMRNVHSAEIAAYSLRSLWLNGILFSE